MVEAIFHGHAFVEIYKEGLGSILIDPFINENPKTDVKLDQLIEEKNIRAIVLTHGHSDHLGDTFEIAKRTGCLVIATFELAQFLQGICGWKKIHSMHIGGEYNFSDFIVKFVPAVHGGGILNLKDGYVTFPAGVIIRIDGKSIYHAGDTGLTYDMKLLGEYDNIDIAFLPIGDNFTMGIDDAVIATQFIKPKIVVPIHYSTWPIIDVNPIEFARKIMLQNISIPKILKPGQSVVLK